jgi:hypothetical protein
MPTGVLSFTGPGWSVVPGTAQLTLPAAPLAQSSFEALMSGFAPNTTYYRITAQVPVAMVTSGGDTDQGFLDAAYVGRASVVNGTIPANAGSSLYNTAVSLPAEGRLGSAINGTVFRMALARVNDSTPTQNAVLTVDTSAPINMVASTDPSDGGSVPAPVVTLTIAPTTFELVQGNGLNLNAVCQGSDGSYYPSNQFTLTLETPGAGTFPGGGTTYVAAQQAGGGYMVPVLFTSAPAFAGLAIIRCNVNQGAGQPKYWNVTVKGTVAPPVWDEQNLNLWTEV